jgi:hypothetical protein
MKQMIILAALGVGMFLTPRAKAQSNGGEAEYCTDIRVNGKEVSLHNGCGFAIKYYWIPYAYPTRHYNNFLDPGETTTFEPEGRFKWYACNAQYHVVGPDGRVIDHLVESYRCVRG